MTNGTTLMPIFTTCLPLLVCEQCVGLKLVSALSQLFTAYAVPLLLIFCNCLFCLWIKKVQKTSPFDIFLCSKVLLKDLLCTARSSDRKASFFDGIFCTFSSCLCAKLIYAQLLPKASMLRCAWKLLQKKSQTFLHVLCHNTLPLPSKLLMTSPAAASAAKQLFKIQQTLSMCYFSFPCNLLILVTHN